MLFPSIDRLLNEVNTNRFKIIIAISKRARQIDEEKSEELTRKKKSISQALEELVDGDIFIVE